MIESGTPSVLPASLLAMPEMIEACSKRDLSEVFRLVKLHAGIFPSRIARYCGMTPSRVGEVMAGRRRLRDIDVIERIADGLRIPGHMLGLADRKWEIEKAAEDGRGPVERRDFVKASTGIVGGQIADLIAKEPVALRRNIAAAKRATPAIASFDRTAESLGADVVRVVSPKDLIETTLVNFQNVRRLVQEATRESDRHFAIRVSAKLANVIGEILFNAGDFASARSWYLAAQYAATEVGDYDLVDSALAGQAYLPTYSDDPQGVLTLVTPRLDQKTTPRPAVAWLWAFRAKAHATLGDKDSAERSFDQAQSILDRSPKESIKPGIFSFLPEKLDMYRAHAYVTLGQPAKAIHAADSAIALYDASETTEPMLARFERASALVDSGETEEACRVAIEAILAPNLQPSVSIKQRARKFDATLSGHSVSAVQEWRDVLWTIERY